MIFLPYTSRKRVATSVLIVADNRDWAEWFGRRDESYFDICNYRFTTTHEYLRNAHSLSDEFEHLLFYRENLATQEGRSALYLATRACKGNVGFVDNYDDPVILRCANDPRIIYFKLDIRLGFAHSVLRAEYIYSMLHEFRMGYHSPLTPMEAYKAIGAGRIRQFQLSINNRLPLEVINQCLLSQTKRIPVSMIATVTPSASWTQYLTKAGYIKNRLSIARVIRTIPGSFVRVGRGGSRGETSSPLTPTTYAMVTSSSLLGVAPLGVGHAQTYRYFEIAALKTVPLAPATMTMMHDEFVDREEILVYSGAQDVKRLIEQTISDEKLCRRLANAAYLKFQTLHTPRRRVAQLIESLTK